MRKLLFYILVFSPALLFAQLSPRSPGNIQNATTPFGTNVPLGNMVYDQNTQKYYFCIANIAGNYTLTTGASSFKEIPSSISQWVTSGNNIYYNSGLVGIGTTNPIRILDTYSSSSPVIGVSNTGGAGGAAFQMMDQASGGSWNFKCVGTTGDFKMRDNYGTGADFMYVQKGAAANTLYLKAGGNLGIGVTNPTSKLDVGGDVNFNKYKAIAMVCDNGATFPTTPNAGQWFLLVTTGRKILYQYNGASWTSVISLGALTYYVDDGSGSDVVEYGYDAATAYASVQFAVDQIPPLNAGNVVINVATGTYYDAVTIQGKAYTGNYTLTIQGPVLNTTTVIASGTMTSSSVPTSANGIGGASNSPAPSSMTNSGASYTVNAYIGKFIEFNNNGVYYPICSNTATTIVFADNSLYSLSGTYKIFSSSVLFSGSGMLTVKDGQLGVNINNIQFDNSAAAPITINQFCTVTFTNCWIETAPVTNGLAIGQSLVLMNGNYIKGLSGSAGMVITTGRMGGSGNCIDNRGGGSAWRLVLGAQLQGGYFCYGNGSTVCINSLACNLSLYNMYFNNWTDAVNGADNSNISFQNEAYASFVSCTRDISKQLTTRNSNLLFKYQSGVTKMTAGFQPSGNYNYFNFGTSTTSNDLVIASDNKIGIGTATPLYKLDVAGSLFCQSGMILAGEDGDAFTVLNGVDDLHQFRIDNTNNYANLFENNTLGKVGIGVAAPYSLFHIRGDNTSIQTPQFIIDDASGQNRLAIDIHSTTAVSTFQSLTSVGEGGTPTTISLNPNGGNVGVGLTNPSSRFEVAGLATLGSLKVNGYNVTVNGNVTLPQSGVWSNNGTSVYYTTGNVGVGTSNPTRQFEVSGTMHSSGGIIGLNVDSNFPTNINTGTSTGDISIGTGATTQYINIGSGIANKTITIGHSVGTGITRVYGGANGLILTSNGATFLQSNATGSNYLYIQNDNGAAPTNIGTGTTTGAVTIGGSGAQSIAIGDNAAGAKTITIGNLVAGTTVNIKSQLPGLGVPVYARTIGSATATTTLIDITGLSVAVAAGSIYEFEAVLNVGTSADANGNKYGLYFSSSGGSVVAIVNGSTTSTACKAERLTAFNPTASGAFCITSSQTGGIIIKGLLTTTTLAGSFSIQHQHLLSGTSTVYAGSYLKVTKVP